MNKHLKLTELYETVRALGFDFGHACDAYGASQGMPWEQTELTDAAAQEFIGAANTALRALAAVSPIKDTVHLFVAAPCIYINELSDGESYDISGARAISFRAFSDTRLALDVNSYPTRYLTANDKNECRLVLKELYPALDVASATVTVTPCGGTVMSFSVFDHPYTSAGEVPVLTDGASFDVSAVTQQLASETGFLRGAGESFFECIGLFDGIAYVPAGVNGAVTLEYSRRPSQLTAEMLTSGKEIYVDVSPDAEHLLIFLTASIYLADREPELCAHYRELYDKYSAKLFASKRGGTHICGWLAGGGSI